MMWHSEVVVGVLDEAGRGDLSSSAGVRGGRLAGCGFGSERIV